MLYSMIFLSVSPYPLYDPTFYHDLWSERLNRDTAAHKAAYQYLAPRLEQHGILFIDYITIAELKAQYTVCGYHYLCRWEGQRTRGVVGLTVLNVLLNAVCALP